MTLYMFGFNNFNMSAWNMQPLCCNSFNPFNQVGFGCSCYSMSVLSPFSWMMPQYPPMYSAIPTMPIFSAPMYSPMPMQMPMPMSYGLPQFDMMSSVGFNMPNVPMFNPMAMQMPQMQMPQMNFSSASSSVDSGLASFNPFSVQYSGGKKAGKAKGTAGLKGSSASNPIKAEYTTLSGAHLDRNFLNKVKKVANNINCDYQDLLAVMNSESGLNPRAEYKNKKTGEVTAVGLIQFTKYAAIPELNKKYGLNLTVEKIKNMSAMEQLDLVEKYYKMSEGKLPKGKKLTAADLYAVTFLPGRANREILCEKGERDNDGKLLSYYESNSPLDLNGDNKITKTELEQRIARKRVNLETFA